LVVDVEIEVFDRHTLPGEVEGHTPLRGAAFVGLASAHLFLSGPHDDALAACESPLRGCRAAAPLLSSQVAPDATEGVNIQPGAVCCGGIALLCARTTVGTDIAMATRTAKESLGTLRISGILASIEKSTMLFVCVCRHVEMHGVASEVPRVDSGKMQPPARRRLDR
jgi:hypothetical protein